MNENWKKKYYFDDKSKIVESSMPSTMPCNVSPFVQRSDYVAPDPKNKTQSKNGSSKCCTII